MDVAKQGLIVPGASDGFGRELEVEFNEEEVILAVCGC